MASRVIFEQPLRAMDTKKTGSESALAKRVQNKSEMPFEKITKNPGLHHIAEDIFKFLNKKSLMNCRLMNKSWKEVLDHSMFWLKMMEAENVPEDLISSWKTLIQELDNEQLSQDFVLALIKMFSSTKAIAPLEMVLALGQTKKYTNLVEFILEHIDSSSKVDVQYGFRPKGKKVTLFKGLYPIHLAAMFGLTELLKKLLKNYDSPVIKSEYGSTLLHCSAFNGHLAIVKFLANLTENPLTPNQFGVTPIHDAAFNGQLETLKFLANLTENPMAPNQKGFTPIHYAAVSGHLETLKFLVGLTENPMAPNNLGYTPIHSAANFGKMLQYENSSKSVETFFEMVKFMIRFTDNPNIPINGWTPLKIARHYGHLNAMECHKFSFLMWRRKFLKF